MPLTLEVVGQKAARMGAHARKTFHAGGTIGREPDNDWEFPDEYISGHHAKITFAAGVFTITDTSTNGVFVNSPQGRLTRGQPYTLRDGDTVYIDDYEVRVTLGVEPAFAPQPMPSLTQDDGFDEPAGVDDTDPLKLLGIGSRSVARGPTAEGLANKSALSENFQPPPPRTPPPTPPAEPVAGSKRMIPKGYNPFAPKVPPIPEKVAQRPFVSAPLTEPLPDRAATPASKPKISSDPDSNSPFDADSPRAAPTTNPLLAARARIAENARSGRSIPPLESRAPPPQPQAQPQPQPQLQSQPQLSSGSVPQPSGTPMAPRAVPGGRSDLDFAALLAAAGIDSLQASPELAQQFGQILRTVVAGLMDVLRARDTIKNEFRMRMTTFKQIDNNPLKYSANVEDALFNLLVKRNPAYLGPVEAFDDAFQDVRSHQMSMLAGMRVAYDSMLAAFDPAHLQEEFDRQVKSGSFLNSSKSKYWDLYGAKFRDMVKDADSTFRKLFGDEFAKAYEEQLSRLRTQKRADRR